MPIETRNLELPLPDTTASAPLIRFEDVSKSFGERKVLDGLSLEVNAGERVTLIGPSGSGKTTILRMLMTLERPDVGEIYVGGDQLWKQRSRNRVDVANLRRIRRNIGMVFQQFNLFPNMSVIENVTLAPTTVLGVPAEQARVKALENLDRVGLLDKASAHPSTLSGGQQQRVAIARALALDPAILLLDEVTSALDPELVGEVLGVLRDVADHSDITMLIVTHEMRFAREVSDRVLMFDHGHVIESGPPVAILSNPSHERTRAFVSSVISQGNR
jgi:polar amino acid transport system ATP-binding protein